MLRSNKFTLPDDWSIPIIMIGTGTGIAPFRSFWKYRQLNQQKNFNSTFGDFILFYGCREKHKDFLYTNEIESLSVKNIITEYHVAFSRDPNYPKVTSLCLLNLIKSNLI